MKTAISVPDALFEQADRLAKRLSKTRSQLYTEALVEYLERYPSGAVTGRLDKTGAAPAAEDRFVAAAARRILERVEW
jgi:predicted transcriptional regulator